VSYSIRFFQRARDELDRCCEDYPAFGRELWTWIRRIAAAEAAEDRSASIDIVDVVQEGLEDGGSSWRYSWRKWWEASPLDKIRAAYVVFRKRCPPWRLRLAVDWLLLLERMPFEVHVVYVADHVAKGIIITKFDGLPGQP